MAAKRSKAKRQRPLRAETLETRRCLAASLGWDGPGEGSADLSYYVGAAPSGVSQAVFESAIETALNVWSDVIDVDFTRVSQAGLRDSIDFRSTVIDGSGGTLAQAYLPDDVNPARVAGDVEFDSSESWEIGNSQGRRAFDLLQVAVHEIGHALGIDHLSESASVLAPYVSPTQSFRSLSEHDIDAALALYAPSNASPADTVGETDDDASSLVDDLDTHFESEPSDFSPQEDTQQTNHDWKPWLRNWFVNGRWQQFGGRMIAAPAHHNSLLPSDVDGNGKVTPQDVLMVINWLVDPSVADTSTASADANGDGYVTPADVLQTINDLIRQASGESIGSDLVNQLDRDPTTTAIDDTVDVIDVGIDIGDNESDEIGVGQETSDDTSSVDDEDVVDESDESNQEAVGDETLTEVDTTLESDDDDTTVAEHETDETSEVENESGDPSNGDSTTVSTPTVDNETESDVTTEVDESDSGDSSSGTDTESDQEHCPDGQFGNLLTMGFERLVGRFDSDNDGGLSEAEVGSGVWAFAEPIDADDDGVITVTEIAAFRPNVADRRFNRLDDNEDGVVTADEVNTELWGRLVAADANDDAAVAQEELDAYRDSIPSKLFQRLDDNGDLSITQDEVNAMIWERLVTRDANEDGSISPDELPRATRPRFHAHSSHRIRFPFRGGLSMMRFR